MLAWTRRRAVEAATRQKKINHNLEMDEIAIPQHFRCPITLDLMKDPVILLTGITYDRESIDKWVEDGNFTCPVTNQVLSSFDQIPNHFIRKMIQDWCVQNRSYGVQRIPTPRIPVTAFQVSDVVHRIRVATEIGDYKRCKELVKKMNNWSKESERNKKCIVENGGGLVLSIAFESFIKSSMESCSCTDLLEEILSALIWVFPIGAEGESRLGSETCLRSMLWILQNGNLSAIQNAVHVVKQLVSLDQSYVNKLANIEGVVEALIELIKKPICPSATKASLMVIFYMISPSQVSDKMATTFVEMGLISVVIEILVDGDKSISDKALGVLDHICDSKQGREKAYENALIMPVLFHKISGSDLASQYSVSILWKLCKNNDTIIMAEALQLKVDAFQKLLILLQLSCPDTTKDKAKHLLKLLNFYRANSLCFDSSMDFRYL
ncbi:U-box domain-containing protein 21-like [Euphorbia lathyris]|uniref:U-box domain-containing protein 21-like n=1 Tax=Euphorbia lathyris TaxID=212925 RepID=UPI003313983A